MGPAQSKTDGAGPSFGWSWAKSRFWSINTDYKIDVFRAPDKVNISKPITAISPLISMFHSQVQSS